MTEQEAREILYLSGAYCFMKTYTYHLIIGSNLGDRSALLAKAYQLLVEGVGIIHSESNIYETQPWGYDDQPWFLNQVLGIRTGKSPTEMLSLIKEIEIKVGRMPGEKWHARHMDIDILLCGDLIIKINGLEIPHPLLHLRNFVLVPLMELIPDFTHPVLGVSIEELYEACRDTGEVYIFSADE